MKKVFTIHIILLALAAHAQKTTITTHNHQFDVKWGAAARLSNGAALLNDTTGISADYRLVNDVALFWLTADAHELGTSDHAGILFENVSSFRKGVVLWRYKPWNSWTKPIAIHSSADIPEDDVQFYYWQYADGVYGAAVPLSGNGFRTTVGSNNNKWGSVSASYTVNKNIDSIPSIAISFGKDPFELVERIYRTALQFMGKEENRRVKKKMPEPFNYIGWCSWNASDNGNKLNEQLLIDAAKSFQTNHFPLGWVLVDDGWFQQDDKKLQSYRPSPIKFPNGFKPVTDRLKKEFGIKYVGVWHTLNGLWNGIDPSSDLGKHFAPALFTWKQKDDPGSKGPPNKIYSFIRPDSDSLFAFYSAWHAYLKQQGFDFVKVDNQLVTERIAVDNYPVFTLADSMHRALYRSVDQYFHGAVINCMDMTADAYLNFGSTAVARAVEDFFPYKEDENYDLQHGNAAAHVLQAVYNSIYFGQLVYPDFDLFQSHNPNAYYHAIARAINCGPIYITDNIGEQNFEVLRPLIYEDGKIIRSETPLMPTADCLFQVQDKKLFKAWSIANGNGLLGVWNAADTGNVSGHITPTDVNNIAGQDFICYEYFSKQVKRMKRNESLPLQLDRMGYRLYYIIPVKNEFAAFGLSEKYNAPATIEKQEWKGKSVAVKLHEGGIFKAFSAKRPRQVLVDGISVSQFDYDNQLLTINVPMKNGPVITIHW